MQFYSKEGVGKKAFQDSIREVIKIIQREVVLDACPLPEDVPKDIPNYIHLIEYVRDRTQHIFENNPALLFWVDLRGQSEVLYIRIKMRDRIWPVTLLTLHFSQCQKIAPKLCEQSFRWCNEAFDSIFGR